MYYRRKERGEDCDFSPEELMTCMKNQKPGLRSQYEETDVRFA
jgi:hypothetical protein